MRGRLDDAIESRREAPDGRRERRRPPGGKPLVRLLQLLESAGYTRTADTSIRIAVGQEETREEFRAEAARFTSAPRGVPPDGETTPSAGYEQPSASDAQEPGESAAMSDAVADLYV